MKNKTIIFSLCLSSAIAVTTLLGVSNQLNQKLENAQADKLYTINLKENTNLSDVRTEYKNPIEFKHSKITAKNGSLGIFDKSGYIENATPLTAIKSIKMDYDKAVAGVILNFGYFDKEAPQIMYGDINFKGEYSFTDPLWESKRPTYFQLQFTNATTVNSITIEYYCIPEQSNFDAYKTDWQVKVTHPYERDSYCQMKYNPENKDVRFPEFTYTGLFNKGDTLRIVGNNATIENDGNDFNRNNRVFNEKYPLLRYNEDGSIYVNSTGEYSFYWKGVNTQESWINGPQHGTHKNFTLRFKMTYPVPEHITPLLIGSFDNWTMPSEKEDDANIELINKVKCTPSYKGRLFWERTFDEVTFADHEYKIVFIDNNAKSISWTNQLIENENGNLKCIVHEKCGDNFVYDESASKTFNFDYRKIPAPINSPVTLKSETTNKVYFGEDVGEFEGKKQYKIIARLNTDEVIDFAFKENYALNIGFQTTEFLGVKINARSDGKAFIMKGGEFTFYVKLNGDANGPDSFTIVVSNWVA